MAMQKTTVYLPESLKRGIERLAQERGVSEAELIRQAIEVSVANARPRPRAGLIEAELREPIDWQSAGHLAGFGS